MQSRWISWVVVGFLLPTSLVQAQPLPAQENALRGLDGLRVEVTLGVDLGEHRRRQVRRHRAPVRPTRRWHPRPSGLREHSAHLKGAGIHAAPVSSTFSVGDTPSFGLHGVREQLTTLLFTPGASRDRRNPLPARRFDLEYL